MKKWIFSLALTFSVTLSNADIQAMIDHGHSHAPKFLTSADSDYIEPSIVPSRYLSVKGMQIEKFNPEALKKLNAAFVVLEAAVNSEEFKDRVINFVNTKGERAFASNNGLSNEEIYEQFMEGRETLQQDTPHEMNFYLRLYNRPWSRVIGYTTGDTNVININWRFFKNFRPEDVAANLAHEWTHKLGFDHKSAAEHDSAPYAIGYIVGDIAHKIISKRQLH